MHLLYLLSVWWLPKLYVNCMLYRNITLCYMPSFWRKHTKSLPFNQMHSDRAQCFLVSFVYHIFYTRRRDVFVSVCVCVQLCDFFVQDRHFSSYTHSVDMAWLSAESWNFADLRSDLLTTILVQICCKYILVYLTISWHVLLPDLLGTYLGIIYKLVCTRFI